MKRGYIRLSSTGPSENGQRAALAAAGVDDVTVEARLKAGAPASRRTPMRDDVVESLQPGDLIVIASPGCIGVGRADVLHALGQIAAAGAGIHVVSADATIYWSQEAVSAAMFAVQAEAENTQWRARHARAARAAAGETHLIDVVRARSDVKALWRDVRLTVADIGRRTGLSRSTLYRAFGPRMKDGR